MNLRASNFNRQLISSTEKNLSEDSVLITEDINNSTDIKSDTLSKSQKITNSLESEDELLLENYFKITRRRDSFYREIR